MSLAAVRNGDGALKEKPHHPSFLCRESTKPKVRRHCALWSLSSTLYAARKYLLYCIIVFAERGVCPSIIEYNVWWLSVAKTLGDDYRYAVGVSHH